MRIIPWILILALAASCGGEKKDAAKTEEKKDEAKKEAKAPAAPSAEDEKAKAEKAKAEFQAYQNKAKASEAIDVLDRISRGATAYFQTSHFSTETGDKLPRQFPASAPATPAKSCREAAADKDGDGRCDVDFSAWGAPTWAALMVEMSEPHYYVYAFDATGTGAEATFTATAFGDLDGDGVLSTFQRAGKAKVEDDGYTTVEMVKGMFVENELE